MHLGLGLDGFVSWRAELGSPQRRCFLTWRIDAEYCEIAWSEERMPCASISLSCNHEISQTVEKDSRRAAIPWHFLLARIIQAHGGFQEMTTEPEFTIRLRWPRFRIRSESS